MNKRITILTSLVLLSSITGNIFAMERTYRQNKPSRRRRTSTFDMLVKSLDGTTKRVSIQYNPKDNSCSSQDIYKEVGNAFGFNPGEFNVIIGNMTLPEPPENIPFLKNEITSMANWFVTKKSVKKISTFDMQVRTLMGKTERVSVEYNAANDTCTSQDIYTAVGNAFGFNPGEFTVIIGGTKVPEPSTNTVFEKKKITDMATWFVTKKR